MTQDKKGNSAPSHLEPWLPGWHLHLKLCPFIEQAPPWAHG